MRIRTGHSPDAWSPNEPASVVIRHGNGIEAEPIGNMRPLMRYASNGRPLVVSDARRATNAEASRRYRARPS